MGKRGRPRKIVKEVPKVKKHRKKILSTTDLDFRYRGRGNKWIILQLDEECDLSEKHDIIVNDIKTIFGENVDYFIPVHSEKINEKHVSLVLFQGYVFVKCTELTGDWDFKNRTENIVGPLYTNNVCKYVRNRDINKFKDEIQKMLKDKIPKKGQSVIPKEGDYKNMTGKVLSVNKTKMTAVVVFEKRSRVVEAPISIINLEFA